MNALTRFFARDWNRYEGTRPVQVWGLRLFYLLMLVFVTPEAWRVLLQHLSPWDPLHAMAFCVWATYPALAVFGLFRPLRWLPLMIFTIGYKTLWLAFYAWPLWNAGKLAGSSAEQMAYSFAPVVLLAAVVPWGYVLRELVGVPSRAMRAAART